MFSVDSKMVKMIKIYCNVCYKYGKLKKPEEIFSKSHYVFSLFAASVVMNIQKYLKKKNQLKYYKLLV